MLLSDNVDGFIFGQIKRTKGFNYAGVAQDRNNASDPKTTFPSTEKKTAAQTLLSITSQENKHPKMTFSLVFTDFLI